MKAARQWLRAVKVWGVGDETYRTRQQDTRTKQAHRTLRRYSRQWRNDWMRESGRRGVKSESKL